MVRDAIIYNSDCRVEMSDDARYVPMGNGTEVGMLNFLAGNDFSVADLYLNKERVC
jgi:hypothetical protein